MSVLALNCGSSSVKAALLDPVTGARAADALAERVGTADVTVRVRRGEQVSSPMPVGTGHREVVAAVVAALSPDERSGITGIGHRLVHGGDDFLEATRVDDDVLARLRDLTDLAPVHIPGNVAGVEAAREALPGLPNVAVFDTAFHRTLPPVARRYAVPEEWYSAAGVRRYGFHGISHRYVSGRVTELLGAAASRRVVTLHLGNGCSATAVLDGASVDTTMGMTPLEGLVMGTRSGDVDAGALELVGARLGLDLAAVVEQLNTRSGLLGVSGESNDMRTLLESAGRGSARAALAVDLFCYRVAKAVGSLAVSLGGIDAVVFTGGIGEHAAPVRADVLARLGLFGMVVDAEANATHGAGTGGRISSSARPVALVVPTDEELMIARETVGVVGEG